MEYAAAVEAFAVHLAQVRRLSPATVRAYRADLADLGRTLHDDALASVDLEVLRPFGRHDAKRDLGRQRHRYAFIDSAFFSTSSIVPCR